MDTKEITQKSAKKDIWEAYQAILQEEKNKKAGQAAERDETISPLFKFEDKDILAQAAGLNIEKIINEIGGLKISTVNMLDMLSNSLTEEIKKLDSVNRAVEIKNKELQDSYKIEKEAVGLLDLITIKEQKKTEFQKELETEEEKMKSEIARQKIQQEREAEEYVYQLEFSRKKEDDEQEFKKQIKEREFNEKLASREKELAQRELKIKEQENEIQNLKAQAAALPEEIEKAKKEAAGQIKSEMEKQFKIEKELLAIEQDKEKEVAKLKIAGLEDAVKKQAAQIHSLESQLAIANQKAQELAIKIIESGGFEKEEQKTEKNTFSIDKNDNV